jgi:hypothetical protein
VNIIRNPTDAEIKLINHLVQLANLKLKENWLPTLKVKFIDNAQSGSLYLFTHNITNYERPFEAEVSECTFKDIDGVTVTATLTVDDKNQLLELDIWKEDFSNLKQIADTFN